MEINTKVCIVGGGPGGAFASGYLNKCKIPHVLIEAEFFPRSKPCGDTISIHDLEKIKSLFPQAYSKLFSVAKMHEIKGLQFYPPNNKVYKYTYLNLERFQAKTSSYTIKRDDLDLIIFQELKTQEYAQVYEGVRANQIINEKDFAIVETSIGKIKCDVVLVASGCKGNFAKQYTNNNFDKNHFAVGIRAYFNNVKLEDEAYSELYINKRCFLGGIYISSLGNNLFNVNIVMKSGSLQEKKMSLNDIFLDLLNTHPVLSKKFENATLVYKTEGHGLMLGSKKRKISMERTLFIGDAAGLIDIVTANGIPQAMKSAKIAVEVTEKALAANIFSASFFKQYDTQVYKTLKRELRAGRIMINLLRYKITSDLYLSLANVFLSKRVINFFMNIFVYSKLPFSKENQKNIE